MEEGILLLPSPGLGHLFPTIELGRCLLRHARRVCRRLSVIILVIRHPFPPATTNTTSLLSSPSEHLHFIHLPPVDPPEKQSSGEAFMSIHLLNHKSLVESAISTFLSSSPRPIRLTAIVLDLFSTTMIDIAQQLNLPVYIFFTSSAATLSLMLHLDTPSPGVNIPGMNTVPHHCLPSCCLDTSSDGYYWFLYHSRRFRETKGIIINTFTDLETQILRSLMESSGPKIFPVGPLIVHESQKSDIHDCIKWLNDYPPFSVVFLCFGSIGVFSDAQEREIAKALERSGLCFLWCLRVPSGNTDLNEILPEGFLEKTKNKGLVCLNWVPQLEILSHPAIGGFVSHCGWNSVLESLSSGVPILAWPLHAEQKLNALLLTRELGLAVDMGLDDKNTSLVMAEQVEKGLRCLMESEEGRKVRENVLEMEEKCRRTVEEGGCSFGVLQRLIEELTAGEEISKQMEKN